MAMQQLGRLLLTGYALAAAGGVAVHQAGLGLLPAVVAFWVGGAVVVAILAVIVSPFLAIRPASTGAGDAALADTLRLWEEDRLSDIPATTRPALREGDQTAG
jgi:hypothetical protein